MWGRTASFLLIPCVSLCFSSPSCSAVLLACLDTLTCGCVATWEGFFSLQIEKLFIQSTFTECPPRARTLVRPGGTPGSTILTKEFRA